MRILGIETSCDETATAIYDSEQGLVAHEVYSQIETHQSYGGVVPELASRDHIRKACPLIQNVLKKSRTYSNSIHGIAYTKGPGLIGALMVGASVACSLAYAWKIPALGVHHLESHLMAVMLEEKKPEFPFIALLVSGGHTLLVLVKRWGNYELLGESLDDAAGEAFDKTAKLLGLPYPGGPSLSKLAEQGDCERFYFTRPMLQHLNLNFSFSGLKTSAVTCFKKNKVKVNDKQTCADIACAFEDAVVDILLIKSQRALKKCNIKTLIVVGGVGANKKLRQCFTTLLKELDGEIYYPRPEFCTDNGAMVAYTGYLRLSNGEKQNLAIQVNPRWKITELNPLDGL